MHMMHICIAMSTETEAARVSAGVLHSSPTFVQHSCPMLHKTSTDHNPYQTSGHTGGRLYIACCPADKDDKQCPSATQFHAESSVMI